MLCKNGVSWLYRLERNYTWESGRRLREDLVFRDRKGKVRLIVEASGRITVTRGYSWNGCSPKLCVLDILLGTPEGVVHAVTGKPKTYYASLVHDALYQFLREGMPLKRPDADRFFLRLLRQAEFAPRGLYWLAVRALGWLVWLGKKQRRRWKGTRETPLEWGVPELAPPGAGAAP